MFAFIFTTFEPLQYNHYMNYRIGVDIGGTNTQIGLVDENGKIKNVSVIGTRDFSTFSAYSKHLSETILKMCPRIGTLLGIGIGAPNGNIHNGTIEFAPNLPWKGILPIQADIQKLTNFPAFVTNDANAAAMGEKLYGGAKNMNDFIVITLGTGVGSGIYSNGQLISGHHGFAGEIGHVITVPHGRLCACGRNGCIEAYASAQGIVKTYLETNGEKDTNTSITTKNIYDLACNGDESAIQTFEKTAELLGLTIANSVAYTNPEAIFLFGGIVKSGNFLIDPLKKHMEENLLVNYKGKIRLLVSELEEANAAILGASALVV